MYITPVINQSPMFSGDANIDNNCFMENREQQILSEIKSMVASIRSQLEMLDAKMVEFHQAVDPEGFKAESINVIIDDIGMLAPPVEPQIVEIPLDIPEEEPETEIVPEEQPSEVQVHDQEDEIVPEEESADEAEAYEEPETEAADEEDDDDDLPFDDVPAGEPVDEPVDIPSEESDDLPEESVIPIPVEEPVVEEPTVTEPAVQEQDDDDLPGFFDVPETVTVASKAAVSAKPTINDAHSTDQAWRKDMPGTPVKDIRSAISLNDRVIFINNLFAQDAQAFVNTLSAINSMASLDEVVEYTAAEYPHWDLNSDIVYRFMMAVRRKVNC